jgi:hypothetical protein
MAKATDKKAPTWNRTPGTFIAGQEEIDEVDLVAIEMEKKWGCDRLRLLVPKELREKFDRQRYLFNQAIYHGDLEEVRQESRRMIKAWRAADKAAEETGAKTLPPEVWEVTTPSGKVVAIVRTNADARHVIVEGRTTAVFLLEEIGRLIEGFPALAKAKEAFSGISVTKVRSAIGDPLTAIKTSSVGIDDEMVFRWENGDEIPF